MAESNYAATLARRRNQFFVMGCAVVVFGVIMFFVPPSKVWGNVTIYPIGSMCIVLGITMACYAKVGYRYFNRYFVPRSNQQSQGMYFNNRNTTTNTVPSSTVGFSAQPISPVISSQQAITPHTIQTQPGKMSWPTSTVPSQSYGYPPLSYGPISATPYPQLDAYGRIGAVSNSQAYLVAPAWTTSSQSTPMRAQSNQCDVTLSVQPYAPFGTSAVQESSISNQLSAQPQSMPSSATLTFPGAESLSPTTGNTSDTSLSVAGRQRTVSNNQALPGAPPPSYEEATS